MSRTIQALAFFAEWLVVSIYIDIVIPEELKLGWRMLVAWITIVAILSLIMLLIKKSRNNKV